jgi:hypothetical protein
MKNEIESIGWQVFTNPPATTVNTRDVGGVLCRWWGDGPAPAGVAVIDAAASQTWTKVSVSLPDDEITVLLAFTDGEVWPGYKDGDRWRDLSGIPVGMDRITHWMDMPAGPAEVAA